MRDVFISYSSKDAESAEAVRNVLERNHIPCWMAPRDIPPGSNYAKAIPDAIRDCRVFLLMLSEKSQQSPWVPKELKTAIGNGKIIIPLVFEDCSLTDEFNFLLTDVQRYEAYHKKSEFLEELVDQIYAITGKQHPTPPPPPEPDSQEPNEISSEPPVVDETTLAKASASRRCPVCGSNQVVIRDKAIKTGKAIAGATAALSVTAAATVVAGAVVPFLGLLPLAGTAIAGITGGKALYDAKDLLIPTEFRCNNCGHEFELNRQNKEKNTEAEPTP